MNDLDDLLTAALSCYRELLQSYTELNASGLAADSQGLERLVEGLRPRLAASHAADAALLHCLEAAGSSQHHLPMLRDYRDLLSRVAEANQVLLGRARTHCALVAAEMAELRAGKTALAGYRMQQEEKGRSLSEAY
ncbi:MAG: hypothetical protein HGA96_09160 [Desulfobulbaceae bacterium]|nr:hypothetical protein [Desulfobulbaceae bacterium]